MIIFVIGMSRSGSTFSFNIARDILSERGAVFQDVSASVPETLRKMSGQDHVILKAHHSDETTISLVKTGAVKAICTIRKPEDAIASSMETFGISLKEAILNMREWLILFKEIRHHALVLHYEKIEGRPLRAVAEIAQHIYADVRAREIVRLARSHSKANIKRFSDAISHNGPGIADIGYSIYDSNTLFHKNHVRSLNHSRASDYLSHVQIRQIRSGLEEFVDDQGQFREPTLQGENLNIKSVSDSVVSVDPVHDVSVDTESTVREHHQNSKEYMQTALAEQLVRCQEAFGALSLAERVGSEPLRSSTLEALSRDGERAQLCCAVTDAIRTTLRRGR